MAETPSWALPLLTRITYLRVALAPVAMLLILVGDEVRYAFVAAAVVFAAAAATDFLDGFLARRWGATTILGSFLDTTADKLLVTGALIALVAVDRASAWIAFVIVGRELVVLGLKAAAAGAGTVVQPSLLGKLKASAQFVAIILAILRTPWRLGPLHPDEWAMIAAAVVTVLSGADYLVRFSSVLRTSAGRGSGAGDPPADRPAAG